MLAKEFPSEIGVFFLQFILKNGQTVKLEKLIFRPPQKRFEIHKAEMAKLRWWINFYILFCMFSTFFSSVDRVIKVGMNKNLYMEQP